MRVFILSFMLFALANPVDAQTKLVPQTGHRTNFCMALSADDKKLVTADLDGRVMVWDIHRTKAMHNFKAGKTSIYAAAWKPDGSVFAIGTADSVLILFDGNSAEEVKRFKTPFAVNKICFNPKHDVMAIGGSDGNVKVLSPTSGDVYFSFRPGNFISGLEFSSNGALLFTASWDNGLSAYEMNQGKTMMTIPSKLEIFTTGMRLCNNDEFLLLYLSNGTTEVINLSTGKNTGSFNNNAYYQDANGTYYLEPVMTGDNRFIISTDAGNNMVVSHREKINTLIYNNSFTRSAVTNIVVSHTPQFFILSDMKGAMSVVYFTETSFNNESPLLWHRLQLNPERIYHVDFTDNDNTLAMTGNGYYRFNMATGDMHRRDNDSAVVSDREYLARYFMMGNDTSRYYYADLLHQTGYEIKNKSQFPLQNIIFSSDTQTVALVNTDNELVVYDLENKKKLLRESFSTPITLFNGLLNNYFVVQVKNELRFITNQGTIAKTITLKGNEPVLNLCADEQNKNIYLVGHDRLLWCYDFNTGKKIGLGGELNGALKAQMIDLSRDGKTLAVYNGETIKFYGTANGQSFFSVNTSENSPYNYAFNQQGNRIAIAFENGITEVWDLEKKQKVFNALASTDDGMVVYTDDHYYMATREAARQLVITEGSSLVSLANAELLYNRPDKVLATIGLSNQKLLQAYRFAYERRIKNKQVNTHVSELPSITLMNRDELSAVTGQQKIALKIKASSPASKLSALRVWLNDVPVYGKNGISTGAQNEIEKELGLELVSGSNRIKYSVVNEKGIESEKEEINIVYTQSVKPNLYLLTIGTSRYKNPAFNLTYAAKDAQDMVNVFAGRDKNNGESPYANIYTKTIVNEEVTKTGIEKTKAFLKQAGVNDVVMVFVAGHGVRDSEMKYFFGTHDMDFDYPETKGFSEEDFAAVLDGIKPIKRLVFFDTCLSGELDQDEAEQTLALASTGKSGDVFFRTAGAGIRTKTAGLNNASALMREIYNDLDEGTGSTVISSAGGAEFAMESSEWKNGLFTYCFLNGLKNYSADKNGDKQITVKEIQDHVRAEVMRLSKGKQQPSFKDENLVMNYRIW